MLAFLHFLHDSDVKLTEEMGFGVRHTFTACWFISPLPERQLSFFFFFSWWGLMLLGRLKFLIPRLNLQVAGTTVVCHYTQVSANFKLINVTGVMGITI